MMNTHHKLFKVINSILIFTFSFSFIFPQETTFAHHWDEHGQQQFPSTQSEPPPEDTQGPQEPTQDNQPESEVLDPAYLHSGEFILTREDINIPSRGMPLEIIFTYRSQKTSNLRWGYSWFMNYDYKLKELHNNDIIILDGTGRIDQYTHNEEDTNYAPPAGIYAELIQNEDGSFTLTKKDKTQYNFDLNGNITNITDRNRNTINFAYAEEGLLPIIGTSEYFTTQTEGVIARTSKLTKITDTMGREVNFNYDHNGRLRSITDSTGRTWNYYINLNGDLETVITPATDEYTQGLTTTYAYIDHNLETITNPNNQTYLVNSYNQDDRLSSQDYGNQGLASIDYDLENKTTAITDRKGYRTEYKYDDNGSIKQKTVYTANLREGEPDYYQTFYEHNSNMERTKILYPKGNAIQYTYDEANGDFQARGNLLEIRRKPLAGSTEEDIVTSFTYEGRFNFVKTITDPKGNTTTYTYDYELDSQDPNYGQNGNLVKITYPITDNSFDLAQDGLTPITEFTYNQYGQVETITDPNGIITKYEYYEDTGYLKNLIQDYSGLGAITQFTYDAYGNVDTVTDAKGNITNYDYNASNKLIRVTTPTPFNYVTKYSYDENGNLKQIDRQANEEQTELQTTKYAYTILDQLHTITDPLGNVTTFGYDANGNRNSILDAEGKTTTYEYDERNLLWKTTNSELQTTNYSYDENTNLKEIKDGNSNVTQYAYDDFDRLETTTYADDSSETYGYDANSDLTELITPNSELITYTYDALNRLDLKTYPDASTVDYIYDLGSRLTSVTDANGILTYTYDNLNRVTQSTIYNLPSTIYEYDLVGNRTKLIYPDADYITYTYDELNRLTGITDSTGQTITNYTYDPLSRRTKLKLANHTKAVYSYDSANRLLSIKNKHKTSDISIFIYSYDKVGNRKSLKTQDNKYHYIYDELYQLNKVVSVDDATSTRYTFDPIGNRKRIITDAGFTHYITNNLNQITKTQEKLPDNSILDKNIYSYDLNGNLTKEINKSTNQKINYIYDYENRLTIVKLPDGSKAKYTYDAFGRRIKQANWQNSQLTNYTYDGDQLIAEYDNKGNLLAKYIYGTGIDEVLKMERGGEGYYYHYDGLGSVVNITDSTGAKTESYEYDAYGQPTIYDSEGNQIQESSIQNRFMFTGREYDAETELYYYRSRYYSPTIGRFLQRDLIGYWGGINLYTYCGNDPINWVDPWGLEKGKKWEFGKWLFPIEIQVSFNPAEAYAAAYGPFVILYGPLYRAQHPLVRESIRYHEVIHTRQWGWGLRDIIDIIQKQPKSREIEAYTKQKQFIQEKIKSPDIDPENKKALEKFLEDIDWFIANPENM